MNQSYNKKMIEALTVTNSIQQTIDSMTNSGAYAKILTHTENLQKTIDLISSPGAYENILAQTENFQKTIGLMANSGAYAKILTHTENLQKTIDLISSPGAYENILAQTENFQKTIGLMASSGAYEKILAHTENLQKTIDSISSSGAYAKILAQTENFQKTIGLMASSGAYEKILAHTENLQKTIDLMSNSGAYAKLVENVDSFQKIIDSQSFNTSFQNMMESLAYTADSYTSLDAVDIQSDLTEASNVKRKVNQQLDELRGAKSPAEFLKLFTNLHPYIQIIILYIIGQIMMPIFTNIAANIITPHVESIIQTSDKPKRELVKNIASMKIDDIYLEQHRFVTVENLSLREHGSTKSTILDNLKLGQVVTVISREKSWLQITYINSDGEVMTGWVFARYAAKFQK